MQHAVIALVLSLIALDARAETKPSKSERKVSSWRVQFPKLSINADFEAIGTGFVAVGRIESGETTDFLVVRLDAKGKEMWRYREGTKDVYDNARGVAVGADGGVLVVGERGEDAVATRLGANGKRTWSVKLAGKYAHDAVAVKGGWVIAGADGWGARLWFVDAKGKVGWTQDASGGDAYSVRVRDGGVVAVGEVSSANGHDAFFWSVDLDGKQRAFERMTDPALSVSALDFAPTATGYVVPLNLWKQGTGTTGETVKLVELDREGKLVREVPVAGKELRFRRIATNPAGGFTVVGHRNATRAWILNLDDKLVVTRNETFSEDYSAADAVVATGGRIVIAGLRIDGGTFIEAGPAETVGTR